MQNQVTRFDRGNVKGDAKLTDEGYIRAKAVVTRTGVFLYQNPDGTIRRELRHPEDVWDADSIKSMYMIPVTNGHPAEKLVSAENASRLSIGHTGETVINEDPFVIANMVITHQDGVNSVTKFGRKELSLGYTVDLEETSGVYNGDEYDARQRNIRYNHLAIVDKARAGNEARIALDSQDAVEILKEVIYMSKKKIKIDNEEMMIEESVADYIMRLETDMKNLEDERDRVERELKMIADKLAKAEGERDSSKDMLMQATMKEKEMTNNDSDSFHKAVSERMKLFKVAENNLDSATVVKLDSMSNLDIKKEVIRACRKSVSLDGKTQPYIDAMFDTILDDQVSKSVNVSNVTYADVKADSGQLKPVDARQKMMQEMKQAHKGGQ